MVVGDLEMALSGAPCGVRRGGDAGLVESIRVSHEPPVTGRDGCIAVVMAMAAERSLLEGRRSSAPARSRSAIPGGLGEVCGHPQRQDGRYLSTGDRPAHGAPVGR